ncbi:MAG: penicillin-binding protein, partial [Actinomycetales bacterium]|nr:penicillin-binding protein [Actinomycetales bacterium]
MVWLSALSGVLIAAMFIPASAFMITTGRSVSKDIVDLPLVVADTPNPQTTRILASNGQRIAYFYQENRQDIPLKNISPSMQDALVSIEDYRFFDHGALDLKGTMRALLNNASSNDGPQGGSTLTQQLVKLTLLQQAITKEQQAAAKEVSVERKIRELKIAIEFEEKLSKEEILERYLNIAYYGDGAYGVNAAAYHFFSVKPADLTVKQAATLAGLVQNPDRTNPRVYPERALQRRNTVLAVMAKLGKIDRAEAEKLSAEPLGLKFTKFPNGCVNSQASFSCDYIRRYLLADEDLGETVEQRKALLERGGLTVKSNIDLSMQDAVNKAVKQHVAPKDKAIGALALVEPGTGKVRALGQSRPMGNDKKKGETYLNYT